MGRELSRIAIGLVAALVGVFALAPSAVAAPSIGTEFVAHQGYLISIGWDPATGNVFVYKDGQQVISEFTATGSFVDENVKFPGTPGNDADLDFVDSAFAMGPNQTQVPAGTLLLGNGDDTPEMVYAMDKDTGRPVATMSLEQVVNSVGFTHHGSRGSFYFLDWASDVLTEVNPQTGATINQFTVAPDGSPLINNASFGVFYGDVDVHPTSGNLFVGGSNYDIVRELTPTGGFVRDIDLTGLNLIGGISGLAFDSSGDLWLSMTGQEDSSGRVYRIAGLLSGGSPKPPPPECSESDSICTGSEDDTVDGTSAGDFIYTAGGDDTINSGGGNDTIMAGAGNDGIAAGAGADHVQGGSGDDTILGDSIAPRLARSAAGSNGDVLEGQAGEDTISGEAGGDQLDGGADGDSLNGGRGSDSLKGGGGRDVLKGAQGFDLLNGGAGRDTCFVDSKKEKRRAKNCERFRRNL